MIRLAAPYFAALLAICVLDFAWLGFAARDFYRGHLGALLLERPNWAAAALFYLMYAAGTLFFAVLPAHDAGSWPRALATGALFGLFCYGTYDLSNLATLKGWPVAVAAVDIVWGMVVTGAAALAGYGALRAVA